MHHVMEAFGSMTSQCAQLQLSHPRKHMRSRRISEAKGPRINGYLLLLPAHDVAFGVRSVDAMVGKQFFKHQLEVLAVALVGCVDDRRGRDGFQTDRIHHGNKCIRCSEAPAVLILVVPDGILQAGIPMAAFVNI